MTNALQNEEDKANRLSKLKIKLESAVQEGHDDLQKEKQIRSDVEKAKRRLEGDLKVHTQFMSLPSQDKEYHKHFEHKRFGMPACLSQYDCGQKSTIFFCSGAAGELRV